MGMNVEANICYGVVIDYNVPWYKNIDDENCEDDEYNIYYVEKYWFKLHNGRWSKNYEEETNYLNVNPCPFKVNSVGTYDSEEFVLYIKNSMITTDWEAKSFNPNNILIKINEDDIRELKYFIKVAEIECKEPSWLLYALYSY